MKCASCSALFNDGVQCGSCKKHLDFNCAQIAETSWRKLGANKRAAWKCPMCRSASPAPPSVAAPVPDAAEDTVTLELVFKEIRGLKSQLSGLPALLADVRAIKEELADLKDSHTFTSARINELSTRSEVVSEQVLEIECSVSILKNEMETMKAVNSANEQRTRLNNIEIKGVPIKKDENLFDILSNIGKSIDFSLEKSQVNYIYRVPTYSSKEKSIIVSFLNRYVKENFVAAARAKKHIAAADVGFSGCTQRVFVNDHLSAESKNLLTKTKSRAKDKGYSYCWVKFSKIHVRKNDTSPVIIISKESDLKRIA